MKVNVEHISDIKFFALLSKLCNNYLGRWTCVDNQINIYYRFFFSLFKRLKFTSLKMWSRN